MYGRRKKSVGQRITVQKRSDIMHDGRKKMSDKVQLYKNGRTKCNYHKTVGQKDGAR